MTKINRPALRYFGGKWRLAQWVIGHFPAHTCYVEPFGGGASVLIQKPPAFVEIYNDLNDLVVNFFRVLRDRPGELERAIDLTPYSRQEYIESQEWHADPLERARRFAVWCWQGRGRGGVKESGGWRFMRSESRGQTPCDDWNNMQHLLQIAERFKYVQIEQSDALRVIETYDTPETLFYVDPPYVPETRALRWRSSAYLHDMSDDDHRRLAERLQAAKGMVVLSGYPNTLYDDLYAGWMKASTTARRDALAKHQKATEVIWMNEAARSGIAQRQIAFDEQVAA